MFIDKNIKYKDILIFALIAIIGYKLVDNYDYFFSMFQKGLSILTPFMYALVVAYILNPIVKLLERKTPLKRGACIAVTYFALIGVVFIVLFFTIPSLINSIINISGDIPGYVIKAQKWINISLENKRIHELITQAGILSNLQEITTNVGNISMSILQNLTTYLVSFTSNLVNLILGFLISVYVLIEKDSIVKIARTITFMSLKEKYGKLFINFIKIYNKMIGTYVGIKAIDSIIIGIIALIGLLILGVPYAPLLALIVAITNMIPYFGPLVGIVISAIVTVFSSFMLSLMVIVLLFGIQQFDAWYLEPKLIGKKVGVSPLAIILGVTFVGGILGPIGMILGSPTMATLKIYYDKLFYKFKRNNEKLVKDEKLEA